MIFIGYKDNSYRFIHHTQENVIFHSTQAIFDEGHFPRYPSSHSREQIPPGRLTQEIELLVPEPFGVDEPAPTPFSPTPAYSRPFTPPIPPNLPTHSESPSPSPLLTPPKWSLVKIEEVEDNEDEDVEMHFPSPPPPEAGPSQYTTSQVPTVIPQKQGSDPQPGEDVSSLRYGLRRSTCETRVPYREGNIYEEDCYPTDVLRHPKWQQHPGKTNLDMACRMLENACRHIQAQPETIPIGGVYYLYSQWDNTVEINGIHYEVDWVGQQPIIIDIEENRIDAPPPAGKSATTAITNHMVYLAREGGAEHICFLLALRATETHVLPKTLKDVTKLPADSKKRWLESCLEELKLLKDRDVYEIVDLPKGRKVVKNYWVFNIKPDGCYRSRLIAKGFSQVEGINFDELFSPVVRYETAQLLLVVAALEDLDIQSVDIKTAYLYGNLDEEIYIEQPEGFKLPGKENKVW